MARKSLKRSRIYRSTADKVAELEQQITDLKSSLSEMPAGSQRKLEQIEQKKKKLVGQMEKGDNFHLDKSFEELKGQIKQLHEEIARYKAALEEQLIFKQVKQKWEEDPDALSVKAAQELAKQGVTSRDLRTGGYTMIDIASVEMATRERNDLDRTFDQMVERLKHKRLAKALKDHKDEILSWV